MCLVVVLVVKNPPLNAIDMRDTGSVPRLGRSPGGGHSNPLQYSCLENLLDRGARQATVHRVAKSWTRLKWLSTHSQWLMVFPVAQLIKNPPANAGGPGSIPGSGRSHGEGNGYPLQYSCLGNPMDRGAWPAIVHGVARVRYDLATKPAPPMANILDSRALVILLVAEEQNPGDSS